ncbi:MAG: penicillin-resistant DD-carboxypeptidase [Thermoleophilia bacterium]|nr:penicillin-resistant DD-carboxypeptidase [Thermoleophilia bacterium]
MIALVGGILVVIAIVAGAGVLRGGSSGAERTAGKDADASARVRPSAVVAAEAIPELPAVEVTAPATTAPVDVPTTITPAPKIANGGSGWAPAAATVAPEDAGSGLLKGDLTGIHPELIRRLDALAVASGREIEVISGWRTRHEQEDLYDSFLSGAGNLAAVPGTSNHETGRAADVYVDGVALASVDGMSAKAAALGLHFPVQGEAWHVEMVGFGT